MQRNMIETVLGGVVLVVAGVFIVFAYTNASLKTSSGYRISAEFDSIGDLKTGDDVKLSGIKVGSVVDQQLDRKSYRAVISMTIEPNVELPDDSSAEVASEGLMGGAYILISPGASSEVLSDGGRIRHTQGAVSLVDLIGKAMFSSQGGLGDAGLGGGELGPGASGGQGSAAP